jgi:hypothetical protein
MLENPEAVLKVRRENAIMNADDPSSKDTAGTPGEGANPESSQKEPLVSAAGAAKTATKR